MLTFVTKINIKTVYIMKHFTKTLVLSVLLLGSATAAMAGETGVTFLFRNGKTASFAFASKPCIAMTAGGVSVTSTTESAAEYQFSDVQRYYFEEINADAIRSVSADAAVTPVFRYSQGVMTVQGMKPGERISAATVSGSLVSTVKADEQGNARLDLSAMPQGMYVIATAGGVGCKIVKK